MADSGMVLPWLSMMTLSELGTTSRANRILPPSSENFTAVSPQFFWSHWTNRDTPRCRNFNDDPKERVAQPAPSHGRGIRTPRARRIQIAGFAPGKPCPPTGVVTTGLLKPAIIGRAAAMVF